MPKAPKDLDEAIKAGVTGDPFDSAEEWGPPKTAEEEAKGKRPYAEAPHPAGTEESPEARDNLDELAPLGNQLFTLEHLKTARTKQLLPISTLPGNHGWGEIFNSALDGGISPGILFAIGAASAGAGKTSYVMQLADGLALRNTTALPKEPLTPVLLLSEMSPEALAYRRLAWLTEERASTFRAGRTAEARLGANLVNEAYRQAEQLLTKGGDLHKIQSWQRQLLSSACNTFGATLIEALRTQVSLWKARLQKEYKGREIWPIVIIDPVQRWLPSNLNEVEALNEIARATRTATDKDGWICFLTSDTNKSSAKGEAAGDAGEVGAALFRGSYALIHNPDVCCYLSKPEDHPEDRVKTVPVEIFKNRLGPSFRKAFYRWDTPTGRFRPLSLEEQTQYEAQKKEEKETPKKSPKKTSGKRTGVVSLLTEDDG